jgi:hypothetical protein
LTPVTLPPGRARLATRPRLTGVSADGEKNGDRLCCCLGHQSGLFGERRDHGNLAANQIGRKVMQSINLILGEAVCDRYVLALGVTDLLQALAECAQTVRDRVR